MLDGRWSKLSAVLWLVRQNPKKTEPGFSLSGIPALSFISLPSFSSWPINGLTVGEVHEIKETDEHLSRIRVTLSIKPGIKIPANSVAYIKSSFGGLSAASIVIEKGDSTTFLKNRETIKTWEEPEESPVGNFIKGEKIDLPTILRVVANAIDSLQKDSTGK